MTLSLAKVRLGYSFRNDTENQSSLHYLTYQFGVLSCYYKQFKRKENIFNISHTVNDTLIPSGEQRVLDFGQFPRQSFSLFGYVCVL